MNIGVYGGTFNPPHMGHLIVIESLQDQLHFDKILFVPCASPPHKRDPSIALASARLHMTKLAVDDNRIFEASDIEIQRGGTSYSVDTLNVLKETYPHAELSLIIGADNYIEFEKWKSPKDILSLADLVVMNRPGYSATPSKSSALRMTKFVNVPNIGISGTDIRRRVKHGRSIHYLVPRLVEDYIVRTGLYRD